MAGQISNAVATVENGPGAMVEQYRGDLSIVMPSHIKPDVFIRLAVGVLRRDPKLATAAKNNTGALMSTLMECARLGLEPGTEQFYLVRRYNGKTKREEVAGIRGYQGEIELIYRAGAVSSVNVEVVRERDLFVWKPGSHDTHQPPRWQGPQTQPLHDVDWFGGDRGRLVGVYAFAVMKDGAISKVVVLDQAHVMAAKAMNKDSNSEYSPWLKHEESMWLKTAAHRLTKWVPTSAEYRREELRAKAEVAAEMAPVVPMPQPVYDEGPIDAEVEPEGGWPNEPDANWPPSDGAS